MHHANWMILFVNSRIKAVLFILITYFALKPTLLFAGDWTVYYHSQLPPEAFDRYSLVILDSTAHPDISPMLERGKTVLGYISLGEVADYRYWYSDVSAEGLLLKENKSWPGSYMVDLRDPRWTKRVIEQLVPEILRQGFSGVFIDTLDNAAELERIDPKKYAGMALAATNLIKTIRRHYPEIKIMLNRGYDLLPEVGGEIDIVLGESVFSTYSHKLKAYHLVEENLYAQQLKILLDAKQKHSDLEVYTLDYWDPNDAKGIEHIYRTERSNGFVPYVSTIALDRLIPEPRTIIN
ncbi:MAG: endo alpha-1,4 polygalactosaminidase [Gammaproteobacteria bacterium]|nr:endo alpha-1,4 polygalactosaminidase [Gammaproteobacteria bacterium]